MRVPSIKKLAGETVIYGLSSVLGRAVSFLLLPIYTAVFSTTDYGIQSIIYVYAAVFFVFYVLRFDTAYFRFAKDNTNTFDTAFSGIASSGFLISALLLLLAPWITTEIFNIDPTYTYIIRILACILFLDALSEIPFAQLRMQNRAWRFASIRLTNIILNVGFNCFFLLFIPWFIKSHPSSDFFNWYDDSIGIGYIFISNLIASLIMFLMLFSEWRMIRFNIDKTLLKRMWYYAAPLVVVALAGIINEMIDRAMLDRLLPFDNETNKAQAGIYSAAYKFSILISLFTQAYRYAAEPFFFTYAKVKNSPTIYAKAAEYFVLAACFGFLCIMFFLPILKELMRSKDYHEGVIIVPILIIANIFLGIYYNLSVWYKLTDKTKYAMYIAVGGALVTLVLNFILIPIFGYIGSAWTTLVCYGSMTFASYFIGRQFYTLKHDMIRMILYILGSVIIYYSVTYLADSLGLISVSRYIMFSVVLFALASVVGMQLFNKRKA